MIPACGPQTEILELNSWGLFVTDTRVPGTFYGFSSGAT